MVTVLGRVYSVSSADGESYSCNSNVDVATMSLKLAELNVFVGRLAFVGTYCEVV